MFINFWYAAGLSSALRDQPLPVRMLGQDFVLFRDGQGAAHCLSNVCVHRGGALSRGHLRGGTVQCPYHGWCFDGEGRCVRIPSLGPDARIPGRARVDSYPVEERYGLIHVFLGDLPAGERPPIMEVTTFDQPGWGCSWQQFDVPVDFRRSVENALDPAHNEFVHTTHGFSGSEQSQAVPELDVQDTPWGCGFLTTYMSPPLTDERMKAATGRSATAQITAGTYIHGPCAQVTTINPTPQAAIQQWAFKVPVDECHTRTYLVQMRNFLIGPEHASRFLARNDLVQSQDAAVLSQVTPAVMADRPRELLMPADRAILRYRQRLVEWQARGWRIDTEAVARAGRHAVFAIPCPARRTTPKGWVIDAIPLLAGDPSAAARSGASSGTRSGIGAA